MSHPTHTRAPGEVSRQSYYDYLREQVFEPAGTRSTDFSTKPQWREDRRIAHPYAEPPSGGAFASAPDLARFAKAFQDGGLLEPEPAASDVAAKARELITS